MRDHSRPIIASLDPEYFRRRADSFHQMNEVAIRTDHGGKLQPASPVKAWGIRSHLACDIRNALEFPANPFCLSLTARGCSERILADVPESLSDQARYFEVHFEGVRKALGNARYHRLATVEGRARYLARALALPEHGPAYADQKLRRVRFD